MSVLHFELPPGDIHRQVDTVIKRWRDKITGFEVDIVSEGRTRTAAQNATIAQVQKAHGRNPFWLERKTRDEIAQLLKIAAAFGGWQIRLAQKIGDMMLADVMKHAAEESSHWRGNAVPFRELTPEYAARKAKRYPGQPILRATGEFLDTLKARVRQRLDDA